MTKTTYYLTTPLYYTNSTPHIGHAYTTIAADIIARFHRVTGAGRAHFLTGTDEHGPKVDEAAQAAGKSPKAFVDEIVERWKSQWRELNISYDQFIRTTDPDHEAAVQKILLTLRDRGDVVAGKYEGWYCVNDETFWLERQLINGRCPNPECRRPVQWVSEDAWFFTLSKYRDRLLEHYRKHPDWVRPKRAYNEMMALLESGLEDLNVSRKGVQWGIPFPWDSGVVYVWFDAICNYITAAGYPHDMDRFASLWPADVQLIGKEISRFHTVIWPAILMALELPLPKLVFAHGWITMEGEKMSKSRGNILRPADLIERVGLDSTRYLLFAQAPFGSDFALSEESIARRHNAELANDLGNLVQRTLSMLGRYREGVVGAPTRGDAFGEPLTIARDTIARAMKDLDFRSALAEIWKQVGALNLYVERSKPWELNRNDPAALDRVLYDLCEGLRWIAAFVYPFMPATSDSLWRALGQSGVPGRTWEESLRWGGLAGGTKTALPPQLFPRVESEAAGA